MNDDREAEWKLDQKWQNRITGTACELCSLLEADTAVSSEGHKVADLRVSRWILGQNQYIRGYSILVLSSHAVELFELEKEVRSRFVDDIADASQALQRVLSPIKINLEIQGNVVPHLHCHIKPRFLGDRPGHARIFQNAGRIVLRDEDYRSMVSQLRNHIG
ncbi:HIT family protein [Mesorhizobium sp. CCNWLW179-1]|uniref:HIT family protein n=1 Tax=unclassified Mesorhizobium TaxID=325217 RepID=UPI003014B398